MPKVGMEPIRRRQVIDAVLSCIAEQGLENVTLDKAASRAGVSKGVVAYYFNNKQNLLLESCRYFFEAFMLGIESLSSDLGESVKMRDILLAIGKITLGVNNKKYKPAYFDHYGSKIILQIYSKVAIDKSFAGVYQDMYTKYYQGILSILADGQNKNEWIINDHEAITIHIMALLEGMVILLSTGFYKDKTSCYKIYQEFINNL